MCSCVSGGMFAFAIWDDRKSCLFLARDRIGKKPLYYGWCDNVFLFASEIKGLLAWPGIPREPNLEAIHHYLTLRYIPSPQTVHFKGISRLQAVHSLVVNANGTTHLNKYWTLPTHRVTTPRSMGQIKAEILEHLDEAVRLRMVADVPVGAFLSGGVDSAAVCGVNGPSDEQFNQDIYDGI